MKVLKRIIYVLGGLLGLLLFAVLGLYFLANWRLNNATASGKPVQIPTNAAVIARGEHLVHAVTDCAGCHGDNLEGKTLLDDPQLGYIAAPNLTKGAGGVGASFTPQDWELAIRHGIGADGRALGAMPSHHYAHLSDADLGAILAYIQSVPPVDYELPPRQLSFIATLLFGTVAYSDLPATQIEHAAVGVDAPLEGVTVDYGQYLVDIAACADCHGADLRGRSPQEAETGPPAGPNLVAAATWSEQEFITTMRTQRTPSGRQLNEEMPSAYGGMTDAELQAIWRYLRHYFTQ
jgi:mono/diheme cytochrome c family protein